MPWLFNACKDIASCKKQVDLGHLAITKNLYDRVVIAREFTFSHDLIGLAGPVCRPDGGLLVLFPSDDGFLAKEALEFYYPEAPVWDIDTSYGRALVCEPRGLSWRFYA